jgi:hypothetical protein
MLACCDLATARGCVAIGQIASGGVSASTRSPGRSTPSQLPSVSGLVDRGNGGGSKVAPELDGAAGAPATSVEPPARAIAATMMRSRRAPTGTGSRFRSLAFLNTMLLPSPRVPGWHCRGRRAPAHRAFARGVKASESAGSVRKCVQRSFTAGSASARATQEGAVRQARRSADASVRPDLRGAGVVNVLT